MLSRSLGDIFLMSGAKSKVVEAVFTVWRFHDPLEIRHPEIFKKKKNRRLRLLLTPTFHIISTLSHIRLPFVYLSSLRITA